ncbi:MAG: hypothetical protein AAGA77_10720 [Bacteroidota bacterium]
MGRKKRLNSFERKQGSRKAVGPKRISIHFSWEKLDINQGQSIKDWEDLGLLSVFCERMRQIGGYPSLQALGEQLVKPYPNSGFPSNSNFNEPKHVSPAKWAVIHITPGSKEVVAGYLEDHIFYIVFLDKEHDFWPTDIQSRGKVKR